MKKWLQKTVQEAVHESLSSLDSQKVDVVSTSIDTTIEYVRDTVLTLEESNYLAKLKDEGKLHTILDKLSVLDAINFIQGSSNQVYEHRGRMRAYKTLSDLIRNATYNRRKD